MYSSTVPRKMRYCHIRTVERIGVDMGLAGLKVREQIVRRCPQSILDDKNYRRIRKRCRALQLSSRVSGLPAIYDVLQA